MAQRIILCFVSLLCAFPFWMLAYLGKDSRKPIHFRNGDEARLAESIRDVPGYNREMAKAYNGFSLRFLLCAVFAVLSPGLGLVGLLLQATIGLYLLWKRHMALVDKYS